MDGVRETGRDLVYLGRHTSFFSQSERVVSMMDGMDLRFKDNLRPLSHFLGYTIVGVVAIACNHSWIQMALVLITFFSLWGFRGINGFHSGFAWWRNHAKLSVILQSLFSSSASNYSAAAKNRTAFPGDNLSLSRNMRMDDFDVFTYTGESLTERGRCIRRSKIRRKSSSAIDSLRFFNSVDDIDNCIELGSACLLQTKMTFVSGKSSSSSVAKTVPSHLTFREKELESPTSDQQLDCPSRRLIRLPKHEKLCPDNELGGNECRRIEEPRQECRGNITFASDFHCDVECKEKCKGVLHFMNDGEGRIQLGSCSSHDCVDLGLWRRLVSFEIQFGWDRLLSLRLGYGFNGNCCTVKSGLNFNKFSKYLVRDINVNKVLDSPKRSIVKLFSLQEDAVSSVDPVWNMGISSACTVSDNSTVRLWDIEVGKCLDKMVVDDYAIVGSHIENSPGFLLSGIMIREENASFFVWDPRDSLKPLDFFLGNMLTFSGVDQFNDNKVFPSDCFNAKLFDLRMASGSLPY